MNVKLPVMSKLDAAQYVGVNGDIKDNILGNPFIYGKVKSYFDVEYLPSCLLLSSAFGKKGNTLLTKKIVESRDKRISKYNTLRAVIKGDIRKSDATISDTAKELFVFLDNYGNFSNKSVTKHTPIIDDILLELDGDSLSKVKLLGVEREVEDLRAENIVFKGLISKREDENADKPTATVVGLRKKLNPVIKTLFSMIDVFAISEKNEEYDKFIKKMNEVFKKYGAVSTGGKTDSTGSATDKDDNLTDKPNDEQVNEPEEPVVPEETHEEKLEKARPWTQVSEGEWENGDYCWHLVNSVKTYWRLIDVSQKGVKPYMSGGEVAWERVEV